MPRPLSIAGAEMIVKLLFLLHFRGIPAGGANEVQRVPPRGVCACLSIYLGLSDFSDEIKRGLGTRDICHQYLRHPETPSLSLRLEVVPPEIMLKSKVPLYR
jgi:hypothetical protein